MRSSVLGYTAVLALGTVSPVAAQSWKGTSQMTVRGEERVLDNTTLTPTFCGGEERILRLKTARSWTEGEKGGDAKLTLHVLKPGQKKPLFSIEREGAVGARFDLSPGACLMIVDLGLEDLSWWGAYDLAKGGKLFDSMVEPKSFCLATRRENNQPVGQCGYTYGFYVPSDDEIEQPHHGKNSIGTLMLAHDLEIHQLRFTANNADKAKEMRSYWDERWAVSLIENLNGRPVAWPAAKILSERPMSLKVEWAEAGISAVIPIAETGFDIGRATLPAGVKVDLLPR